MKQPNFRKKCAYVLLCEAVSLVGHRMDVLKACENAYILVEFIFRLVENSPRKRSQQTVVDHATEIQKL